MDTPAEPPDGARDGARGINVRSFVDLHGEQWTVREVEVRGLPGAPRPTCLLFETAHSARRVWDFPAHWRALSEAELEVLSWRR